MPTIHWLFPGSFWRHVTSSCVSLWGTLDGALLFDTLLESSSVFGQLHVGWASMLYPLPLFAWYLIFTLSPQS